MSQTANAICVSAPANTMLMGEHAVLFGHPAIVCAIAQRINVTVIANNSSNVQIDSALGQYHNSLNAIFSEPLSTQPNLQFVLASIQQVKPNQGFNLTIDAEFSHTVGLGSSAAISAACVYALMLFKDNHAPLDRVFDCGLDVIHAVQKRGSGSDLAASVYGGILAYTNQPKQIRPLINSSDFAAHTLPQLDLIYCGYKTPTPKVLAKVAQDAEVLPELYASLYTQMHAVCVKAQEAISTQNWHILGKLMNMYHGLMDALGVSDAKLSELVYAARAEEGVLGAKISGSGLGDCIITLSASKSSNPTQDNHIHANISPQGLILHDSF